jgi:hypothetical protein
LAPNRKSASGLEQVHQPPGPLVQDRRWTQKCLRALLTFRYDGLLRGVRTLPVMWVGASFFCTHLSSCWSCVNGQGRFRLFGRTWCDPQQAKSGADNLVPSPIPVPANVWNMTGSTPLPPPGLPMANFLPMPSTTGKSLPIRQSVPPAAAARAGLAAAGGHMDTLDAFSGSSPAKNQP